eukprot:GHVH01003713.1.p1 GENE.GHVH01003713.1~~GHVH01003713.1.p1  ORF type:complete len:820 (-),score=117.48 GHVH01003713.1:151-2610(-)
MADLSNGSIFQALIDRPPVDVVSNTSYVEEIVRFGPDFTRYIAQFIVSYSCELEDEKMNKINSRLQEDDIDEDLKKTLKRELKKYKHGDKKYLNILQNISNGLESRFELDISDYVSFADAEHSLDPSNGPRRDKDKQVLEILLYHSSRAIRLVAKSADDVRRSDEFCCLPDEGAEPMHVSLTCCEGGSDLEHYLRAPFEVTLTPPKNLPIRGIRDISETAFGSLMRFEVVIAKVFSAQPRIKVAVFTCERCHATAWQPVYDEEFTPQRTCESEQCKALGTGNGGEMIMNKKKCRMISHEVVLGQEPSSHVPQGNVPRRRKFIIEGKLTRQLSPGMICTITGIPEPQFHNQVGFGEHSGKVRDTIINVEHIHIQKRSSQLNDNAQALLDQRILEILKKPDHYTLLANSIAPSVFGLEDVKKALLLQLIGAPKLDTKDGLSVRGEVHILMMGDPGVAKSQLLGKMTKLAPRSAYTSGKSASGVGMTASVFKDPSTGEYSLEGGAVVIADNGICAIDEFDKLDENDRTAIHEVMEQQTVSISKAGLNVQLNARTAILAAANPTYGRYDVTKSVMQNIQLPYSLMSRFDLQFLMLDNPNEADDRYLSLHILRVHQRGKANATDHGDAQTEFIDPTTLRYFVSKAQELVPEIGSEVAKVIQEKYVDIRAHERLLKNLTGEEDSYTTPRTLFSIIRLAQALARVRFDHIVTIEDVEEACRLMDASKKSIKVAKQMANGTRNSINTTDVAGDIIDMVRKMDRIKNGVSSYDGFIPVADIENKALTQGYSKRQVLDAINGYVDLTVLRFRHDTNEREVGFSDRLESL